MANPNASSPSGLSFTSNAMVLTGVSDLRMSVGGLNLSTKTGTQGFTYQILFKTTSQSKNVDVVSSSIKGCKYTAHIVGSYNNYAMPFFESSPMWAGPTLSARLNKFLFANVNFTEKKWTYNWGLDFGTLSDRTKDVTEVEYTNFTLTFGAMFPGYFYAIRVYSRSLTSDEIAANYAVDKARFNLQ